jgi:DNA sulfur modification protein DndE
LACKTFFLKKYFAISILIMSGLAFFSPDKKPTLYLAGDSTMANKPLDENPERGWGMFLPGYLTSDINVDNRAVNGRSTKSFIDQKLWSGIMSSLTTGDFVMIQFGHNDSKEEDSTRYAAPHTAYKNNLIRFVNDVRSKGATPILITPVMRRKFDDKGNFVDQHGDYPGVVREIAKAMNVELIDLHQSSKEMIVNEGVENSKRFFLHIPPGHFKNYKDKKPEDNTHFTDYGAASVAALVCKAVNDQNLSVRKYLKPSQFKEKYAYELPKVYQPHFKQDTVNVLSFGAIADGYTLNTDAINNAINSCEKNGGGVVLIPRGSFVTGPIIMKSNINLHLDRGALVIFSSDFKQYPLVVILL